MASLLDDSEPENSIHSSESDEESILPSYVKLISSPPKRKKNELPKSVETTPSTSLPPTTSPQVLQDSPLKVTHSHKKAIKRTDKLSRKMKELSECGKMRKNTAEKLESYRLQGGILGMDRELQEQLMEEDELSDKDRNTPVDSEQPFLPNLPKVEATDNTPSLPVTPPGRTLFVNPPSLIEELYPPFAELNLQGGPLDGVEQILLTQDSNEALTHIITSQWLKLCYRQKACPLPIWQWLFQIMCRSCDQTLSHGAYVNLVDLVSVAKAQEALCSVFCPSVDDIVDMLISLGVDKCRLSSNDSIHDKTDDVFSPSQLLFGNLTRLFLYLKVCAETCPQMYSVGELESLIKLLARVSLDPHVSQEVMTHDLTLCLSALIAAIPSSNWACSVETLSRELPALFPHHHDRYHLTRLVTGISERLSKLQNLLCRRSIESLLENISVTNSRTNAEFASKVLEFYYRKQSPTYSFETCYEMHSILSMLALFLNRSQVVWSDTGTGSEKEFALLVGALADKVRDHPNHPERGTVKDLLIRMKLEFDGQKTIKRQQGIKDYFS